MLKEKFHRKILKKCVLSCSSSLNLSIVTMLLSNQNGMRYYYRGPSIDASCKILIYLTKLFQRRFFFKKTINQKQELPIWQSCLLTDQDEMINLNRGPSTDASYQFSVHLAKRFQARRLKCEKLTDKGWTTSDDKSSIGLWPGELKSYHFECWSLGSL